MAASGINAALATLANSTVVAAIAPVIVSSVLGAVVALVAYRFKAREVLDGGITWQWKKYEDGEEREEPFLTLHNRSDVPTYLKRARWLRGNFIKWEATRYAFSYDEHDEGNFPLEVRAKTATSFPLSKWQADNQIGKARWYNKVIGYVFKRDYIWIEITTFGGRKLIIPANDATDFQKRPLWIDLRWLPAGKTEFPTHVFSKPS